MTYTCTVCAIEKKEVNHWFDFLLTANSFHAANFNRLRERLNDKDTDVVCGQQCLHKKLDEWLEAQRAKAQ
jgi:rubrerythrin